MSSWGHHSMFPHSRAQAAEAAVTQTLPVPMAKGKSSQNDHTLTIKRFRTSTVLRTHELERVTGLHPTTRGPRMQFYHVPGRQRTGNV